jgi:Domain of unknown function (DUF4136)
MRKLLFALALCALVAAPIGARVKVRTEFDPKADFTKLKTFAWPADGYGQVKMMLSKDDDPEALRKRFEPTLIAAAEAALTAKGLVKAPAGQAPDCLVAYFALISVNTSAQTVGQFLPSTVAWGVPPFLETTSSLKIFEQGSLVVDVMTPDKHPMWRGVAQAEMHREKPQAEREKRVREVITDILKQFPPKKKK